MYSCSRFILLIGFVFALTQANSQFYNGSQTEFGKNRVQYDGFNWQYFRFKKYETYFYEGGKDLAEYTARVADKYISETEEYFDFFVEDRIQFVIYKKLSQFKQSNVGIVDNEQYNIGGVSQIFGSKVFLYFDGSYTNLETQIKAGISEVFLNQIVYGSNWREVLKNSSLMVFPEWYMKGLISYQSRGWTPEVENRIKDGISTGKFKKFNKLQGDEAILAGHAIWHYIAETYGASVIPNIISMARLSRNIESGFLFVLGMSIKSLSKEYQAYYEDKFSAQDRISVSVPDSEVKIKTRRNRVYMHLLLSADGEHVAYVTNQMGQYKVFLYNIKTKKRKLLYKGDKRLDRINDYSFPVLGWHPSGKTLAFFAEYKGKVLLMQYDLESQLLETKPVFLLDKVLSFSYYPNGRQMVLSAVHKGRSDLYLYNIGPNTQKKLTDDPYDDLNPSFIANTGNIVFESNRPDDTLRQKVEINLMPLHYDVFILDPANDKVLQRVTNTPAISEKMPTSKDSLLYFLAPYNGTINRYSAYFDSTISHIDTSIHYSYFYVTKPVSNYRRNIEEYNIEPKNNSYTKITYNKGKYRLYLNKIDDFEWSKEQSKGQDKSTDKVQIKAESFMVYPAFTDTVFEKGEVDIKNYRFEEELNAEVKVKKKVVTIGNENNEKKKEKPKMGIIANASQSDTSETEAFKLTQQRKYFLSFLNDNSVTQLNGNFVNGQYQMFNGGPYISPGLGAVVRFGISDVMEDHKIYGGIRIGGNGMEYFMGYQNLARRLDKEVIATRRENRQTRGLSVYGFRTNELLYSLKYPFSEVSSIRAVLGIRHDNVVPKSTELSMLAQQPFNDYWGVAKLSYVFDNSRFRMLNIYYGTKFKLFAEYYQQAEKNSEVFTFADNPLIGLYKDRIHTIVMGMDFRRYQKIHRELIWVTRVAGGTSFGSQKLIHYLGSVDDWIILGNRDRFNYEQKIDYSQNYRFQTLASPMRGFNQNIRNGNNFAVVNSEIRWPIFKYFSQRPIKSAFITNFQIAAFGDLGCAWNGLSPYSDQNSLNKKEIIDGPITITLFDNYEPIVGGYGFGVRTKFLGYFVKADWAWGVVDRVIQKPIFYLSLSLDI
ncbi:MAG: hypothetical protein HND27_02350 [Bacteroidetes bacterium]|nr:hypothetical protein [Bacteroidota bacterium]MBV6460911.1 Protein TolB [Flavobacteriales bacterium]WKZ75692.1 MAG: hypothetical protein QY303_02115 [Vicingaceae bacterium]MCL4815258.1 hypothetical protein [Flavobacteriales bacterium]NOG94600.1 hypothetical protein [Bacteroidota bacterium]